MNELIQKKLSWHLVLFACLTMLIWVQLWRPKIRNSVPRNWPLIMMAAGLFISLLMASLLGVQLKPSDGAPQIVLAANARMDVFAFPLTAVMILASGYLVARLAYLWNSRPVLFLVAWIPATLCWSAMLGALLAWIAPPEWGVGALVRIDKTQDTLPAAMNIAGYLVLWGMLPSLSVIGYRCGWKPFDRAFWIGIAAPLGLAAVGALVLCAGSSMAVFREFVVRENAQLGVTLLPVSGLLLGYLISIQAARTSAALRGTVLELVAVASSIALLIPPAWQLFSFLGNKTISIESEPLALWSYLLRPSDGISYSGEQLLWNFAAVFAFTVYFIVAGAALAHLTTEQTRREPSDRNGRKRVPSEPSRRRSENRTSERRSARRQGPTS